MRGKLLLVAGILSSLLYATITVIVPLQWPQYSSTSQTISELSAIGAPTRGLWLRLALPYTVLVTLFGWGVLSTADSNRSLRTVGRLILIYGGLGLIWPFAPMHLRDTIATGGATRSDSAHIALGGVTVLLMLAALGAGATALGRAFRAYSLGTLIVVLVFGSLTGMAAPRITTNSPTPWLGLWERICIAAFLLWILVLAVILLRNTRQRTCPGTVAIGSSPWRRPSLRPPCQR